MKHACGAIAAFAGRSGERPSVRAWSSSARTAGSRRSSIDDVEAKTLYAATWLQVKSSKDVNNKTEQAAAVGKLLAENAQRGGVKQVVFDRGGYLYHGRVKALADAARKGGLEF